MVIGVLFSQVCHEKIRVMSHEAGAQVKQHGKDNDLVERMRKEPYFDPIIHQLDSLLEPSTFIGRAPEQVVEFLQEEVEPILKQYDNVQVKPVELCI